MPKRKTDQEIVRDIMNADTGFCNPRKIKRAAENRMDAIFELEKRGYNRAEAEQMLQQGED